MLIGRDTETIAGRHSHQFRNPPEPGAQEPSEHPVPHTFVPKAALGSCASQPPGRQVRGASRLLLLKRQLSASHPSMASPARSLPPTPPARGSFPLDHGGQCKMAKQVRPADSSTRQPPPGRHPTRCLSHRASCCAWHNTQGHTTSARSGRRPTCSAGWTSAWFGVSCRNSRAHQRSGLVRAEGSWNRRI